MPAVSNSLELSNRWTQERSPALVGFPLEIKSGKTITTDYFKGLAFCQKISGQKEGAVIYGGNESQKRSDSYEVFSWNNIPYFQPDITQ